MLLTCSHYVHSCCGSDTLRKQPCSSEVGKQLNLSLHSHHLLALIIRPPWCELPCEQAHLAQNESHSLANRKEVMEALLIEREHVKWIVPATKCGSWGADPSSAKTEGACGSRWHFDWSLVGDPEPPDLAKPCPDSQKNGNWGNRLFSDTKLWGHLIRRESLWIVPLIFWIWVWISFTLWLISLHVIQLLMWRSTTIFCGCPFLLHTRDTQLSKDKCNG